MASGRSPVFVKVDASPDVINFVDLDLSVSDSVVRLRTQQDIAKFIQRSEAKLEAQYIKMTYTSWDFNTNITEETKKKNLAEEEKYALMKKEIGRVAQTIDQSLVTDADVLRKISMLTNLGTSVLSKTDLSKFQNMVSELAETYS